jgi:di/tricarboxylate transporter
MEIALVLLIVVAAVWLFVSERYPSALVAMMILAVLMLVALLRPWLPWIRPDHWITLEEGVTGFSNPATIVVAAMFVLSAGLQSTGAIAWFGPWLGRAAKYPVVLTLALMLTIAFVSAFINNTAAVAVFLPIALVACARSGLPPSRVLIPLSFASQFGGVCTLLGTSTNLLVSTISERSGHGAFGVFEFAPLGLILTAAGLVYLLVFGRWLLPERASCGLVQSYQVADYVTELRVTATSALVGRTVRESRIGETGPVRLLATWREGHAVWPAPAMPIRAGDMILVQAPASEIMALRTTWNLESEHEFRFADETFRNQEVRLAEVIVASRSWLIGQTLAEVDFHGRFGCLVLGVQSGDTVTSERLDATRLKFGDALLVLGPRDAVLRLRNEPGFLMLDRVAEPALRRTKVPLAVGIFAAVVALAAFNVVPILASALFGCVALVATRCLSVEEACEAIDWKVIFLLAGALPLGLALEKSGAAALLAEGTMALTKGFGPVAALAAIYLLTAVLTEFMSNNATAVLLAPVALAVAAAFGVDSRPFLMAVCFAASTSFCTPVGYQTNAMVQHPGGYRFADYLKVGLPLNVLFWGLAVWFIPKFWPF